MRDNAVVLTLFVRGRLRRLLPAAPALMFAAAVLLSLPLHGETPQTLPFARAEHLRRGINASMWFAQAEDYSPARLAAYTTAKDFTLMHRLGFDHVRLSIDAEALTASAPGGGLNADFVRALDTAVDGMLAQQLAVILDIHPSDSYKKALRTDPAAAVRFAALWKALAAHYAKTEPKMVFFEVLNEPEFTDPERWAAVQTEAIAAIRGQAPEHTIIATAQHYSGLEDLLGLSPVADENVIYTFHDYEPFAFTHQGATWTAGRMAPLRRVPYPSSPESVMPVLDLEKSSLDRLWLERYGLDRWDAERVAAELAYASRWGAEHHVPVYCGEFGVYAKFADPASRAAWVHDVRTALERQKIGWAMWDYQGGFHLVNKDAGDAVPDKGLVEALRLHMP